MLGRLDIQDSADPKFCYAGDITGSNGAELWISTAESAKHQYPSDPHDVHVHLAKDQRGLMLPSRIANTRSLLMVARDAYEALEARLELGEIETHPFTLINHKRRVHSRDYLLLNPLTRAEIAHPDSEFDRFESSGEIFDCERWVLDRSKLEGLPDLLRPAELVSEYFVSQRFVDAVEELGLSNFTFEAVEHR